MELLLGCGSSREKRMGLADTAEEDRGWTKLVTCDINPDHHPDVVFDLETTPWPWEDNEFDEVHAYEVLEHLGDQGDYKAFFAQFTEIWRILKPGGMFFASCPAFNSPWLWGDPSHRRAILPETLTFLQQNEYEEQVGKTPMSDFRFCYKADFKVEWINIQGGSFNFMISAVK